MDRQSGRHQYSGARSTRLKWWGISLVCLSLTVGGGWLAIQAKNTNANVVNVANAVEKKETTIYELAGSDIATVDERELRVMLPLSGSLAAQNQATVKSKVAAEVRETLVQEGMPVARGQVVMRFDTADLEARLATQQAALAEAKAKLALAKKTHESQLALLRQQYISQNAFDTAASNVELALAAVKSAESQLDIARRAVADATVRAPIDGIVSKRFVQPGEKVASDIPLLTIVDLRHLILEAPIPASEIPRIKTGQEVVFHVDGFAKRSFLGKVARINPAAEAGARAILVYIGVDNADGALKGGMFAKGHITLDKTGVTPLLPLAALRGEDSVENGVENNVSIVHKIERNTVVAQPVKLGLRNEEEGLVEVISGIARGEQVIVAKLDGVRHGAMVKLPGVSSVSAQKSASHVDNQGQYR